MPKNDGSLFPVHLAFADAAGGKGVGVVVETDDLVVIQADISALAGFFATCVWHT
jgi:hypothetical protein